MSVAHLYNSNMHTRTSCLKYTFVLFKINSTLDLSVQEIMKTAMNDVKVKYFNITLIMFITLLF
jgi:hypothetical protein